MTSLTIAAAAITAAWLWARLIHWRYGAQVSPDWTIPVALYTLAGWATIGAIAGILLAMRSGGNWRGLPVDPAIIEITGTGLTALAIIAAATARRIRHRRHR